MSTKIIEKINEMQESIEDLEEKLEELEYKIDSLKKYDDPYTFYSCKKELKYIILEVLNDVEHEKSANNNEQTIKKPVTQEIINKFFNVKENPIYESINIINVDGVRYLLVKNNSSERYNQNDKYYTYKINKENNHNYDENLSKNKKKLCCHCGNKLSYHVSQQKEYYCYTCDIIKLDYNSVIRHNGSSICAKHINWGHRFHSNDEICSFNRMDYKINSNITISIDKKREILNIDNENYTIYWYYINDTIKYAFCNLNNRLLLCKNSVITHNGNNIPIEYNENSKSYYKLVINGFELSGYRFRSDLLKCIE